MPAYLVVFLENRLSHVHRRYFDGANSVTMAEGLNTSYHLHLTCSVMHMCTAHAAASESCLSLRV